MLGEIRQLAFGDLVGLKVVGSTEIDEYFSLVVDWRSIVVEPLIHCNGFLVAYTAPVVEPAPPRANWRWHSEHYFGMVSNVRLDSF